MSKSILQDKKECWLCRQLYGCEMALEGDSLEKHHVMFGTADRDISERYGLTVWLCHTHHRTGMVSVHMNRAANMLHYADGETRRVHKGILFEEAEDGHVNVHFGTDNQGPMLIAIINAVAEMLGLDDDRK